MRKSAAFDLQLHAVDLTDAEKAKFEEHLKELGYDAHAKDVIARVNAEAKAAREAKEAADAKLKELDGRVKSFEQTEAERIAAQKKKDDEAAAAQKKIDDEKKTLDQRLADLQAQVATQIENATKAQKAEIDALTKQIGERDQQISKRDEVIVKRSVRAAAEKRGLLEPSLADVVFDIKDIKIVDGEPDLEAIDAMIEKHATEKPVLYKTQSERDRDERGRFTTPPPAKKTDGAIDWDKLDDAAFVRKQAEFRAQRNRL